MSSTLGGRRDRAWFWHIHTPTMAHLALLTLAGLASAAHATSATPAVSVAVDKSGVYTVRATFSPAAPRLPLNSIAKLCAPPVLGVAVCCPLPHQAGSAGARVASRSSRAQRLAPVFVPPPARPSQPRTLAHNQTRAARAARAAPRRCRVPRSASPGVDGQQAVVHEHGGAGRVRRG